MRMKKKIITIDGAASSGKSSVSRGLSETLGWKWLSTGVFYRGVSSAGRAEGLQSEAEWRDFIQSGDWEVRLSPQKTLFFHKNRDITDRLYSREADEAASFFSGKTAFRKLLIPFQRRVWEQEGALIAEGRDCGTVLFPDAPLKVFLSAKPHIRAERRAKDRNSSDKEILKDQKARDRRDKTRKFAPLKQPESALVIDTSACSLKEVLGRIQKQAGSLFDCANN